MRLKELKILYKKGQIGYDIFFRLQLTRFSKTSTISDLILSFGTTDDDTITMLVLSSLSAYLSDE